MSKKIQILLFTVILISASAVIFSFPQTIYCQIHKANLPIRISSHNIAEAVIANKIIAAYYQSLSANSLCFSYTFTMNPHIIHNNNELDGSYELSIYNSKSIPNFAGIRFYIISITASGYQLAQIPGSGP